MLKHKVGDRVVHENLGNGEVTKAIKSALDSRFIVAYLVHFDETPDVRYNMGYNPAMVFPSSLRREGTAT